jgi:hypothetical protein
MCRKRLLAFLLEIISKSPATETAMLVPALPHTRPFWMKPEGTKEFDATSSIEHPVLVSFEPMLISIPDK